MVASAEMTIEEHAAKSTRHMQYRKTKLLLQHSEKYDSLSEDFFEEAQSSALVVDFSTALSVGTLQCLRNSGYVSAIPRGYCSYGGVDRNMASNVNNAHAAGFQYVDVYLFPCPTCSKSAATQFNELWNAFTGIKSVGMVWLDVEGTQYWKDAAYNRNFMTQLVQHAKSMGANIGIYSSKYQWESIFGSWSIGGNYPLWYAHYNGSASCASFSPFGGFQSATLHQYIGDTVQCGAGIDVTSYC
jgi:hypothetical protein